MYAECNVYMFVSVRPILRLACQLMAFSVFNVLDVFSYWKSFEKQPKKKCRKAAPYIHIQTHTMSECTRADIS